VNRYAYYQNVCKSYLIDICNFILFEDKTNFNTSISDIINTVELIKNQNSQFDKQTIDNLDQNIKILNNYADRLKQNPSLQMINTANFRFPGGEQFSDSLNITIVELPKIEPLLDKPIEDLSAIESILMYIYIAHSKKYGQKIEQLKAKYKEINEVDQNLHKILDTEAERIRQVMDDMALIDLRLAVMAKNELIAQVRAEVSEEKDAEMKLKMAEMNQKMNQKMAEMNQKMNRKTAQMAKKLLDLGSLTVDQISKICGLSPEELAKLKKS
jgi:hypothetical protein